MCKKPNNKVIAYIKYSDRHYNYSYCKKHYLFRLACNFNGFDEIGLTPYFPIKDGGKFVELDKKICKDLRIEAIFLSKEEIISLLDADLI